MCTHSRTHTYTYDVSLYLAVHIHNVLLFLTTHTVRCDVLPYLARITISTVLIITIILTTSIFILYLSFNIII